MTADVAVPTGPLSEVEAFTLAKYEKVVRDGLDTFVAVGTALGRIRDKALYRATHATFEAYCRDTFSLSRTRAYELMGAADVVRSLSAIADTPVPANEAQARPIVGLPAETAAEVMQAAAERAGDKPITAAGIAKARQEIAPKPAPRPKAKVTTTTRTSEATKVERDVDLDTGEIIEPGDAAYRAGQAAADVVPLPTPPREPTVADAIREAKARPSVAAYKVVERWRHAALSANGIGGIEAVLADIDTGDIPAPDLAIWLGFIEESIAVANEWASAIRRRNLRSVK